MVEPETEAVTTPSNAPPPSPSSQPRILNLGIVVRASARRRNEQSLFGVEGDAMLQSILQLVTACCVNCKSL